MISLTEKAQQPIYQQSKRGQTSDVNFEKVLEQVVEIKILQNGVGKAGDEQ